MADTQPHTSRTSPPIITNQLVQFSPFLSFRITNFGMPHTIPTPIRPPHIDQNDSWECKQHALFFHGYGAILEFIAPFVFSMIGVGIAVLISEITPVPDLLSPESSTAPITTATQDIQVTAIPNTSVTDNDIEDTEPHAYEIEQQTSEPLLTEPIVDAKEAKCTKSRFNFNPAQSFVIGTFLLIPMTTAFFLAALAVQSVAYCLSWSPLPLGWQIVQWCFFSLPCLYSTLALSCWAMLFLDLWGTKTRERIMPHGRWTVIAGIGILVCLPIALVGLSVGMASVKAVEWCQRSCCPAGLEDEEMEMRTR